MSIFDKFRKRADSLREKKETKELSKQTNAEEELFLRLSKKGTLPTLKQLKHTKKVLSSKELFWLKTFSTITLIALIMWSGNLFFRMTTIVPKAGGEYIEGMLGSPIYINPILSQTNDIDSDLSSLIYSSLLTYNTKRELIEDLAESYEVSEDGLEYTFNLKQDVYWHDGEKFNVDDVIATIEDIKDPVYKSPLFLSLNSVDYKKIDNYTIKFLLKKPFAPFPSVLTFGIMPKHLWDNVENTNARLAEFNLKPTGTGPWKFDSLKKDRSGRVKVYTLLKNEDYYGEKPFLEMITFRFFDDFESLAKAAETKEVMGINFVPQKMKEQIRSIKHLELNSLTIPQYTAIFFNQKNNPEIKEQNVREALQKAIPKDRIVDYALDQEGEAINSPILRGFIGYDPAHQTSTFSLEEANEILDDEGYKKVLAEEYKETKINELVEEFKETQEETTETEDQTEEETTPLTDEEIIQNLDTSSINPHQQDFFREKNGTFLNIELTTVDHPENKKAAELIADFWRKLGVDVRLNIVEPSIVQKEIIKKRDYESFLYGQNIGFDPDPYPFWHSSQIEDPGLNLALFANEDADKIMVEARQTTNLSAREEKYKEFVDILHEEVPAIFLYSPTYTYVVSKKIQGFNTESITQPSDRFNDLSSWYLKTKRVLKENQ